MTKDEIIEAIKQMNVVELSDVVKALEEEFGVSAAAPVAVAAAPATGGAAVDGGADAGGGDQSEFEVSLKDIGPNKINVIKPSVKLLPLVCGKPKNWLSPLPQPLKKVSRKRKPTKSRVSLKRLELQSR